MMWFTLGWVWEASPTPIPRGNAEMRLIGVRDASLKPMILCRDIDMRANHP